MYESCFSGAKSQDTEMFSFNTLFVFLTGKEMLHEKNKEIDGMNKEFQRQIQILVEDHRKEVDVSIFVELIYYHRKKDNLDYRSRGKILHL